MLLAENSSAKELNSSTAFQFLGQCAIATMAIATRAAMTTTIGIASLD